jgi:hypothetical protein
VEKEMKPVVDATKPELLAKVASIRTSAVSTSGMLLRIETQESGTHQVADDYLLYASCLPGLKYWHVYGDCTNRMREYIVKGIRKLMDRDGDVTFGPEE